MFSGVVVLVFVLPVFNFLRRVFRCVTRRVFFFRVSQTVFRYFLLHESVVLAER